MTRIMEVIAARSVSFNLVIGCAYSLFPEYSGLFALSRLSMVLFVLTRFLKHIVDESTGKVVYGRTEDSCPSCGGGDLGITSSYLFTIPYFY